uniref:Uncharacterized protein n=1 Tax=Heterorhabditis bacteriophora TaxID=37862 RepID=A0A1I7WI99_HETBA
MKISIIKFGVTIFYYNFYFHDVMTSYLHLVFPLKEP